MSKIDIELANGDKAGETLKQLTNQAAKLRKEIGGLKPGTDEFVVAAKSLNQVDDKLKDIKDQVKQTTSASDLLKKGWNSLPGAGFFNNITSSLGMMKQGVGGLVSSMGVLKGAIAATGIGLLVLAIAALVTWFSKTEEGADLIARAMAILDAIFRQYVESIKRLFSLDVIGFFKGMTTEMASAVKAADDLAIAMDNLEEKESAFQVVQKAGMRDKAELLKMTKDETVAIEDKIKAIDKAMGIAKSLNSQEIENQRERLKIISGGNQVISDELIKDLERTGVNMENKKKFFKKGNITQDDLNEVNEALGRFLEIQQAAFDEERELLTQRTKLTKKEKSETAKDTKDATKEEKEARDAYNKALAEQLAVEQNLRKLNNEKKLMLIDDAQKKEIEKLNIDTEEKILALQGSDMQVFEQTKLLREIQGIELAAINKKYNDKEVEENKKKNDLVLQQEKVLNDARKELGLDQLAFQTDFAARVASLTVRFLSEQSKGDGQSKNLQKKAAVAQILINLLREISLNRLTAAAQSAAALGNPVAIALIQGRLALQNNAARLNAGLGVAQALAFEKGGAINGPRHTGGGVMINAEGGEFMFSRKAVSGIGMETLARMNNHFTFQNGGPINPYDRSRGPVSSGKAAAPSGGDAFGRIESKLDAINETLRQWPTQLQVQNNLSEVKAGLKTLQKLSDSANV